MSDPGVPMGGPSGGPTGGPGEGVPPTPAVMRPASVRLTETARQSGRDGAMMDPANQSLAEALGITYRLLQIAMVVLLAMFLFSGFQTVKENERGVRLLLGKVSGDNLDPGFQFSMPFPVGELLRVDTGATTMALDDSFFQRLDSNVKGQGLETLSQSGKGQLKPGLDGSLITGDQSIAHTRWKVVYRRGAGDGEKRSVAAFVKNILPEHEKDVVQGAVERGVVHAVAEVNIDDLLKQSSSERASVTQRAREIAQASLDRLNAGLFIEQLTLEEKSPPLFLYSDFTKVQSAQQDAGSARSQAEAKAQQLLNGVAGSAHTHLIGQIDAYESAIERNARAEADEALSRVNSLLEGKPTKIAERVIEGATAGEVTAILNEARQYRTSVALRRRAELERFRSKLGQFKDNPIFLVEREWMDAYQQATSPKNVEIFFNPPNTAETQLLLSRDSAYARALEQAIREKVALDGQARREQERRLREFQTDTNRQQVTE
jgi:modulator of FtsH protease HflK